MIKHQNNSTIEKIALLKTWFIHHRETNKHSGIPTQVSKFHEDSPCVSCFIIGALPCFYHSKENTRATSTNYCSWWERIRGWSNPRFKDITLSITNLVHWQGYDINKCTWELVKNLSNAMEKWTFTCDIWTSTRLLLMGLIVSKGGDVMNITITHRLHHCLHQHSCLHHRLH